MGRGGVFYRNIEYARLQLFRDILDETVLQFCAVHNQ
jgi:hypothetical protein